MYCNIPPEVDPSASSLILDMAVPNNCPTLTLFDIVWNLPKDLLSENIFLLQSYAPSKNVMFDKRSSFWESLIRTPQ